MNEKNEIQSCNYVIIGNGIAAVNAVKAIREVDKDGTIQMYGDEVFRPYNRIKLSKSLFDRLDEESILLQKDSWYADNGVELRVGCKATMLDAGKHEVVFADKSGVHYDKLLLATGARNRLPPVEGMELPGVFTLRRLDDARAIHKSIEENGKIVNLGGGIQGLETAWILQQHGKRVSIIEIGQRLMPKQLDEGASEILRKVVEKCGIEVTLNARLQGIVKQDDDRLACSIEGRDTALTCDILIYSAGITPNIELLKNTGVHTEQGILTDETMRTSEPDIYAAGDVVQLHGKISGLWNIAIAQGKTAGYNMAGRRMVYEHIVPVTTLNAFGINLFSMGSTAGETNTSSLVEKNDDVAGDISYRRVFIQNNLIVGAIVIGDTKKSPVFKTAIEKKLSLEGIALDGISIDVLMDMLKNKEG